MNAPAVMFGIGATKAGTSWLYRYLASHPECYLRSIKELHFFDAKELGSRDWHLKELARKAEMLERQVAGGTANGWKTLHLAEVQLYSKVLEGGDERAYLAFLHDGRTDERVVGDITPGYSLLSAQCLAHMAEIAGDARFIYLMRDPVDRLWSHVRMIARRRSAGGKDVAALATEILDRVIAGGEDHISGRGDYRAALEKLQAAIDPDKVFISTYEELFSDEALNRLCEFLGITPIRGNYDDRVHGGVELPMNTEQKRRALDYLRPQYDYVAARMGQMPAAWQASLAGN